MDLKAILFDFDGTLADTAPGIVLTMRRAFAAEGLTLPTESAVRQTIGLPLQEAIRLLGGLDEAAAARTTATYRRFFPECELTHITIFPEVAETLRALRARSLRLAICTSRGRDSLESILGAHGLRDCFETAVTATDALPAKPAPDMVFALLDRLEVSAGEALVVGDTTYDIDMGARAGCPTCAVTYGNHSPAQLSTANPTFTISRFPALLGLCGINESTG